MYVIDVGFKQFRAQHWPLGDTRSITSFSNIWARIHLTSQTGASLFKKNLWNYFKTPHLIYYIKFVSEVCK